MPTFSTKLPTVKKHMGFDLRRTPASTPITAIVTCEAMLICDTHYWGGRTIPCERIHNRLDGTQEAGTCPPCNELQPFRTHVYLSVLTAKHREHFIFECTAHAAKPFEQYYEATATLRGCLFRAYRPKGNKNSQVIIETNTANLERVRLPEPPDLAIALCTIWRLPAAAMPTDAAKFGKSKAGIDTDALDRMREQPPNQSNEQLIGDILAGNGKQKPPKSKV